MAINLSQATPNLALKPDGLKHSKTAGQVAHAQNPDLIMANQQDIEIDGGLF